MYSVGSEKIATKPFVDTGCPRWCEKKVGRTLPQQGCYSYNTALPLYAGHASTSSAGFFLCFPHQAQPTQQSNTVLRWV